MAADVADRGRGAGPRERLRPSEQREVLADLPVLTVRVLRGASFTSTKELRGAIERFTEAYCEDCSPFAWTKEKVHQVTLKRCYADLCN